MITFRLFLAAVVGLGLTFSSCKKDDPAGPGVNGGEVTVTVTINGMVMTPYGTPTPNVPVIVPGKPPVNTDASGRFSIPGITPPYTVAVIDNAILRAYIFVGVTRTDPYLTYLGMPIDTLRSALFSGTIHGGQYPPPPNHITVLGFESPEPSEALSTALTDSMFAATFSWRGGPSSATGAVHVLQYETMGLLPVSYKGYGSAPNVTLTHGGSVSGANIDLSVPGDTTTSGTVSIPAGYTQEVLAIGLRGGPTFAFTIASIVTSSPAFSYTVPRTGLSPFLRVSAADASSQVAYYRALSRGSGNAVTVPQGVQLTLPPSATTNVDINTEFSWTPFDGAVYLAMFQGEPIGSPSYFILTSGTSVSIPNLSEIGVGLPASTPFRWHVYGYSPVAGVDGATGPAGYLAGYYGIPSGDGGHSHSALRSFTTRP